MLRGFGSNCDRKPFWLLAIGAFVTFLVTKTAKAAITFSTFVSAADISAVEGQNNTIAFNYAGNKFVGSVYFGPNNLQLYSTDLNGQNVQKFGDPMPSGGGEVVVAASLGKGGFALGDIYAGSEGPNIYHYANGGGSPTLFATLPNSDHVRQILFDPGSSFGGKMIVTTTSGNIYVFDSAGSRVTLASVGEDTEGMDIATSSWGPFAGQLLVASEGSQILRLISSSGVVTDTGIRISLAETVSFVPLNLGLSGNPLEGFYVANYPVNIQKASASEFAGLQGDAIVTSEFGSNSDVWAVHYDSGSGLFSKTLIGNLPNQSEDGIFVTAERLGDLNPATVPEPCSAALFLVVGGLGCVGSRLKRWKR